MHRVNRVLFCSWYVSHGGCKREIYRSISSWWIHNSFQFLSTKCSKLDSSKVQVEHEVLRYELVSCRIPTHYGTRKLELINVFSFFFSFVLIKSNKSVGMLAVECFCGDISGWSAKLIIWALPKWLRRISYTSLVGYTWQENRLADDGSEWSLVTSHIMSNS